MGPPLDRARFDAVCGVFAKRITFSEVDALGFVHHGSGAIWFEQAREEFFRKHGIPFVDYARQGDVLAMRKLEVNFQEFVAYDDPIEVRTAFSMVGRVACDMVYRVDNLRTGKLAVTGKTNLVAVARQPGLNTQPRIGRMPHREQFLSLVVDEAEFLALPLR